MKRLVLGALLVVAGLALFAPDSWAHGGQFRGPGGSVPPGMRDPSDPTPPPPPPPPSSPPPTTAPPPTTPPPTTPPTPTTPQPTTPPPQTETPTAPNRGKNTGMGFQDWTFWYHHNKDDLENLKRNLYGLRGSGNPLFQIGGNNLSNRSATTRLTEKRVLDTVIPALLWAMDTKNVKYSDTESAAYIALAKIAKDPTHIKKIMEGLDLAPSRDKIVEESAALALGLLHRASPEEQFSARELDNVRTFLFSVFENDKYGNRTRGFAALSLGLLGDQPTGSGEYLSQNGASIPTTGSGGPGGDGNSDEARNKAEDITTKRIFDLLKVDYSNPDLAVGLLMALGMQTSRSVSATPEIRKELQECVLKGKLDKLQVQALTQSYAALTLGRIGGKEEIGVLRNVLRTKSSSDTVTRSAAIGLGLLGRGVQSDDRVEIAKTLVAAVDKGEDSTKNFSLISLAYLMVEDIREHKTEILAGKDGADDKLLESATKGSYYERPFAAIALSLVVRYIDEKYEVEAWQDFKSKALTLLRAGVDDQKMDKQCRAGFITALGIARDTKLRSKLIEIVGDKHEGDKEFRGYSALALGLMGDPLPEVTQAIGDALQERSSEELRRQAATALGLLGNPKIGRSSKDAVQMLLEELKVATSQAHKGEVVVALARIGDDKAVDPMVDILKNKSGQEQDLSRALACAGLGLIGDLEWIPTLSRISRDINYRASTDLINEVLSIL